MQLPAACQYAKATSVDHAPQECPSYELGETVTPSPHLDPPLTPAKLWSAVSGHPLRTDVALASLDLMT